VSPSQRAGIATAGASDTGRTRQHNEDAFLVGRTNPALSERGLWQLLAVADGMGGGSAGGVASELALDVPEPVLEEIGRHAESLDGTWRETLESSLRLAVGAAHQAVRKHAAETPQPSEMGSTLVVAVLVRGWLGVAHVGDSRAYLVRDGRVERLTIDHSWAEEQRRLGTDEADIESSPFRSAITRAIGLEERAAPDISWRRLEAGDVVLLASDGLTRYTEGERLGELIGEGDDLEASAQALVEFANQAGGQDNITVALARFDGLAGDPLPDPVITSETETARPAGMDERNPRREPRS